MLLIIIGLVALVILVTSLGTQPIITEPPIGPQIINESFKAAVLSPGEIQTSRTISFRTGVAINVRAIANDARFYDLQAGATQEQLCLSKGDFAGEARFEDLGGTGQTIRYTDTVNQNIKLDILCDFGVQALNDTLESTGLQSTTPIPCDFSTVGENDLVCVIALRANR